MVCLVVVEEELTIDIYLRQAPAHPTKGKKMLKRSMTVAWQIAGDSRLELGKVLFFFFSPKKPPLKIFEWAENERK